MNNHNLKNIYEEIDQNISVADFSENMAWAIKSEESVFFPEIQNSSFLAKFINFGGFVFISISIQFILYCERTFIAALAASRSRTKEERELWFFAVLENALYAVLTGIVIVSSFFILSCLMLPSVIALCTLDLIFHGKELWDTRNDYVHCKTEEEKLYAHKSRKALWVQFLLDAVMLIFSVLSCLEAPLLLTIGTIGCAVTSIIQYGPSVIAYLTGKKNKNPSEIELTKIGFFSEKKKEPELIPYSTHSLAMRN